MRKAALVLATSVAFLLSVTSTYAATRQTVNHGQTARSMINGQNATTGAVSTPAGAAAFFGDAYVSYHTAGNRFNSGDSVPNSGSGSGSTAKQAVNVTPGNFFNKARAAAMAKNAIKGGVVAVVATAAVEWAITQIPGAEIQDGQPVMNPDSGPTEYWAANPSGSPTGYVPTRHASAQDACNVLIPPPPQSWYWSGKIVQVNETRYSCYLDYSTAYCPGCADSYRGYTQLHTLSCGQFGANGTTYTCNETAPPKEPFTETDWNALEGVLASMANNDWLKDLIKETCNGSLNPDGCFDSLVDNPFMIGPAFQTGTPKSTTTNTTNPDGTTSTTTTTSTPSYSYTYGDTYYDYDTTVTTTTNNNGQVTTTVQTDTQEGEPEEDPTEDQEDDLAPPDLNDPYQPVVTKYNSIAGDVTAPAPVDASVNYSPWYSFGGSCTEIQAELPIYGNWSTNYCPLVNDWVRPILSFLLILFTWHTCYDMWREALRIGRPI